MNQQKLIKLTNEEKAKKHAEATTLMQAIIQLDMKRKTLKAAHKEALKEIDDDRGEHQKLLLAILEDLKPEES